MHFSRLRPLAIAMLACGAVVAAHPAARPARPEAAEGQQPAAPVFRSRVDAIEIELRVLDSAGRPVTDLRPEEVEVYDQGRRQALIGFSHVSVPIATPPPAAAPLVAAPSDVATNRGAAASRIFVIVLDDLHVESGNSSELKKTARQFVERHVGPGDVMSVIYSSGRAEAAVDFTSDRSQVLAAIDKFVGRKLRPATVERMEQYNMQFRGRGAPNFEDIRDRSEGERGFNARALFGTIETVSTVLSRVPGRRKAMILFSEGVDYDLTGVRTTAHAATPTATVLGPTVPTGGSEVDAMGRTDVSSGDAILSLQAAIGAAARGNVALYALDVRRGNVADSASQLGAPVQNADLGLNPQQLAVEMRTSQEALRILSEGTGGFASLAVSDYAPVFRRIVEESSDYYVVAYSPWNIVFDGTYREISVKVKRPGVRVSARKGYYAPRARPRRVARFVAPGVSDETSALVMAPIPSSGLTLDVHAVAMRRDGRKADVIVAVQLDGKELVPDPAATTVSNKIELAFMALDSAGQVQAATGTAVDVKLNEATARICRQFGYRAFSMFHVPPGRYRIRVAAREVAGGRHGSVFADLDVPDFSKRGALSNVLLASERLGAVPTSIDRETLARLPVMPVVRRSFPAGDLLRAAVELYDPSRSTDQHLTTRIYNAAGIEVFRQATPVPVMQFQKGGGAYVHAVQIPLKDLAGPVTLEFSARAASAGRDAVTRRIAFTVSSRITAPSAPTPASGHSAGRP